MSKMNEADLVRRQYATEKNLGTRISLHQKYSANPQGFGNWIFMQYQFEENFNILELGCGNGDMWKAHYEKLPFGASLTLTDLSEAMLASTRKNLFSCKNITFRQADIQDIPYEDNQFDIVIANMMLYHVPDLDKGLSEVKRVLREDGTFYCATFGENGIADYVQSLLADQGVKNNSNREFTLQNGTQKLNKHFNTVKKREYEDHLEVTDVDDLIDYMSSMTSMIDIQDKTRDELREMLNRKKTDGFLYVPKEYGMFTAKK